METWPELAFEEWKETRNTLHLWTQVVGKVKLELCPFLNQWWEVVFLLTARGFTTGPIPWQGESFEVNFDFIFIKRLTKPGMDFFSFETAWRTLRGFEVMNMIRWSRPGNVEKVNFKKWTRHRKGKDHATATANIYERI
ncbi:MAG: DUF5996 family protein [Ktedonobacteraceae bacterium]